MPFQYRIPPGESKLVEAEADRVVGWMAEVFAWDAVRVDAELARYRQVPP